MTLLSEQDGGGGCDSSQREGILERLTRLEDKTHCSDHKGIATKLDTLDGKMTVLLGFTVLAVVVALANFLK